MAIQPTNFNAPLNNPQNQRRQRSEALNNDDSVRRDEQLRNDNDPASAVQPAQSEPVIEQVQQPTEAAATENRNNEQVLRAEDRPQPVDETNAEQTIGGQIDIQA